MKTCLGKTSRILGYGVVFLRRGYPLIVDHDLEMREDEYVSLSRFSVVARLGYSVGNSNN